VQDTYTTIKREITWLPNTIYKLEEAVDAAFQLAFGITLPLMEAFSKVRHQSHIGRTMRRETGKTPTYYQDDN